MFIADTNKLAFDFDVIVAGGGPAGSASATLLSQKGHTVLLLERGRHPRFHIGESLLPHTAPIMERLGFDWSDGNLLKTGAEFIDEATGQSVQFQFQPGNRAYQVERAEFDARLFANAAAAGAVTRQEEPVLAVHCAAEGVVVNSSRTTYRCRYFIDATGRDRLMGRTQHSIQRLANLGRFALYRGYRNVRSVAGDRLFATGNIQILVVDVGWIWVIPLTHKRLSLGLVVQKQRPEGCHNVKLLQHCIDRSPALVRLLRGAEPIFETRAEADFSYINWRRHGLRYACCGDAAGFLDPIFSSGVFFAFKSAEQIADRLQGALTEGYEDDPELHCVDDPVYDCGFQTMHKMIERFYQSGLIHNLFFESERDQTTKREITRLLAGDLWAEDNRFQKRLLMGRRGIGLGNGDARPSNSGVSES